MESDSPPLNYGETIAIYGDSSTIQLATLSANGRTDNKFGSFEHSLFVGKRFGERIAAAKGKGYVFALRPTPQLFTESIKRATQILYAADIAVVLHKLDIGRGDVVYESGTGSSSMTFALAAAVGAGGAVYTFEYNRERFEASKALFERLGFENVFHFHQNVLAKGFACEAAERRPKAVFLDLPKPEKAIPFAAALLPRGGRICAFSPCIEQVQAAARALAESGFLGAETVETIERSVKSRYTSAAKEKRVNVFVHGEKNAKTHTGFLTFATKFSD